MSSSLREQIERIGTTMISGDSTNLSRELCEEYEVDSVKDTVDVTITSPPYADMKTYEADPEAQIGINETYDEYLSNLKTVFEEVHYVTKDTGTLWVVVNTFKKNHRTFNLPGDIIDICTQANTPDYCPNCSSKGITVPVESSADGSHHNCPNCNMVFEGESWMLQDIVIWDKKRALPFSSKGSFRNVFEYVLCFSKTDTFEFDLDRIRNPNPEDLKEWWVNYPERYHPRGKLPDNIWSMVTPSQGAFADTSVDHPAPFPPQLVERILDLTTTQNDVVMDPFAGSGTVCAQATAMGRQAVGVELSDSYIERYEELKAEITEKWESRVQDTEALRAKQEEFIQVISGLRQIRYCRELIRSLSNHYDRSVGNLGIEYVLHTCNSIGDPTANPNSYINMSMELLCDEKTIPDKIKALEDSVESVSKTNPCSSFGINSDVKVTPILETQFSLNTTRLFDTSDAAREGYLYTDGSHNNYEYAASLDSIVEQAKQYVTGGTTYPPIVSTVGVNVPYPGDVCMECGEYSYSVNYSDDLDEEMTVKLNQV